MGEGYGKGREESGVGDGLGGEGEKVFLEGALRGMRKKEAAVMRAIECGRAVLFYFYLSSGYFVA